MSLLLRVACVLGLASLPVGCGADGSADHGPRDPEPRSKDGLNASLAQLSFSSGLANYDAAYAKAVNVIASDIVDGKFIAGESWAQVWTRDTSYSIDLGAGLLHPVVSKSTLKGMTEQVAGIGDVWIQDVAGHFGGWPNLTDSIVGAQGAWSLYLTTGDPELLSWSYDITVNTLARGERDAYIQASGLFGGCSSFMESNSGYPSKYKNNGPLLARTKALSTNLLYHRGYVVAANMGRLLGKDVGSFESKAARLKDAINSRLWMEDRGFYAYFEDENGVKETRMEGTGEAFAILWGVADARKTESILAHTPMTRWGVPSLWPQYPEWTNYNVGDADYYHNGMVWPFVQGYWAWSSSAAHAGNPRSGSPFRVEYELDRIRALSEKNDTFQEFYRPEDGFPDGSRRQLWSASGYLSMVYHGLFGMKFDPGGVAFEPVVPSTFGHLTLDGIPYRNMTLNASVTGSGSVVESFELDGVPKSDHRIPADLTGTHRVDIRMANAPLNLALNKPVTGSAPCAGSEDAPKAVDGSVVANRKWCSAASRPALTIDLGESRALTRFVVLHAGAGGETNDYNTKDFDLLVSSDNANWTTAATVRGNTASSTTHGAPAHARYVKLDVITPTQTANKAARIYEVEVY